MHKLMLFAFTVAPAFAATVYFDGTFNQSDWTTLTLEASNGTSMTLSQQLAGGNPGNYLQVVFNFPVTPGQTNGGTNTVQFRPDFVWDPQTDGALTDLQFEMDIRSIGASNFNAGGFGMFWRPVVVQNGIAYTVGTSSQQPTFNGSFESKIWNLLASDAWAPLGNQNPDPNQPLDFSASGAELFFGFRVFQGASCGAPSTSDCSAGTKTDGLDNFRVTINGASEIPEPSTFALAALGLAAVLKCRRTGATRRSAAATRSALPHTAALRES